ncbi:TIGR04211 family SH3 domain-containing protein [Shewanella sp. SNU WT4]|uniref:TIGR04211 family SH3 domain-containing protein n=1 Tax=Shewanella sp. SNU WT4 TaxID=2590015 RepID=UPI00112A340F|nr:TIGR04211 family SH3 domain-containing protein [Shewanella sp. SNU WT4]QDF68068.1 TIGR04211 family SH3 domain-containing protein [Shewanella sp. SNU WT4]
MALANPQTSYVSEDIFTYIHGGPGKEFRILGSVEAGQQVKKLGEVSGAYTKIIDHKGREGWIKSAELNSQPSFRVRVPELEKQLAASQAQVKQLIEDKASTSSDNSQMSAQLAELNQTLTTTTQERDSLASELKQIKDSQEYKLWQEGALIAFVGLVLGIFLVYLPKPQRRKKNRWM